MKNTNFPQYIHQNFKKPPTTTELHVGPGSCSSRPPPALSLSSSLETCHLFLKAPQLPWWQCYPKHSPFITWITIRKGLSQKEPIHSIILIIFSWELTLVKPIRHADYFPFKVNFCHNKSDQINYWLKVWSLNSKNKMTIYK